MLSSVTRGSTGSIPLPFPTLPLPSDGTRGRADMDLDFSEAVSTAGRSLQQGILPLQTVNPPNYRQAAVGPS